ncbi:uncharacterized protein MAM_03158 [Metarhizium album ARSEF 1941]|uniref:Heat-labile enterotoxin IIB, A chain n=1 Tax=Metarhizium album (strain ARSEF 1941) TaxID=1081103 RepID=A0A0B2WRK8_METAS|nr:uncharacterized protein MAM_03158 [Metarhizium album ARSEF 1941]KHN98696.1 hypothetical protein MAM_03158 [Metarhizium album ARSEF 1941]
MMLPRASTALWLVASLAWHAAVEAVPTPPISMAAHGTVYVVMPELDGMGSPRDFRGQGGISWSRLPAPGEDAITAEWQRLRNIRPDQSDDEIDREDAEDLVFTGMRYHSRRLQREAWLWLDPRREAPRRVQRVWIYEVATAPNVLLYPEGTLGGGGLGGQYIAVEALGGIVWSQVVRFTELSRASFGDRYAALTDDDPSYPDWLSSIELTWMPNPDYNREWEAYGATQGAPRVGSHSPPPQGQTRVQLARELMARVTSSELVPDLRSRQTLRRLLDWDVEREPDRNFPLLQHAQPPRLDASALSQIDWSLVQIPPEVQIALASGLATAVQCALALDPFIQYFSKGPKNKRQDQQQQKDACNKLEARIKETSNVPLLCRKIKNIQLSIVLSDGFMDGTWDAVGGTLEGKAGKADFYFAHAPDAGAQNTDITVDMKAGFGSDEIDITGIDTLTINAQGILSESWGPLKNDEFVVKDIKIRAQCSDPAFKAQNNKYIGINAPYKHPGRESALGDLLGEYHKKTVGRLSISPKDWTFTPPCSAIKDLKYHFKLQDVTGAGTYDSISFTLGASKRIPLGSNLDSGFSKDDVIGLKEMFGKDSLKIQDLTNVTIYDDVADAIVLKADEWNFEGIHPPPRRYCIDLQGGPGCADCASFLGMTFLATCADVPKKVQMNKFQSVNQVVQYKDKPEVWTGDISPQDWLEVA